MIYAIVAASGLLAVVLTLALAREVRLRRALQNLLARIFRYWRHAHGPNDSSRLQDDRDVGDNARRDRL